MLTDKGRDTIKVGNNPHKNMISKPAIMRRGDKYMILEMLLKVKGQQLKSIFFITGGCAWAARKRTHALLPGVTAVSFGEGKDNSTLSFSFVGRGDHFIRAQRIYLTMQETEEVCAHRVSAFTYVQAYVH